MGRSGRLAYTQELGLDSAAALDLNVTSYVLLTQMLLERFSKQVPHVMVKNWLFFGVKHQWQ